MYKCPYCGNRDGYLTHNVAQQTLYFRLNGEPDGGEIDGYVYEGIKKICTKCGKPLNKFMEKN